MAAIAVTLHKVKLLKNLAAIDCICTISQTFGPLNRQEIRNNIVFLIFKQLYKVNRKSYSILIKLFPSIYHYSLKQQ